MSASTSTVIPKSGKAVTSSMLKTLCVHQYLKGHQHIIRCCVNMHSIIHPRVNYNRGSDVCDTHTYDCICLKIHSAIAH